MSFWSRFLPQPSQKDGLGSETLHLLREIYGGRESKSGLSINWQNALEVTTALACARVLAEGVAQVPLKLYRQNADGRGGEEAKDHPLFDVLYRKPNDWQTSFAFRETMMLHLVMCGNFFAYKVRVRGTVRELIPFSPGSVSVKQLPDLSLAYTVNSPGESSKTFGADQIWHVRGPSWNSWMGLEPVKLAREALGLALATEEHHSRMHANSAMPSGIFSVEGNLNDAEHKRLTAWIDQKMAGLRNVGKPFVLDRGAKWLDQQVKGVDTQHLETRRYQVEEICRAFRVMPIMVGHSDKTATYASAEQMFLAHVMYSLLPWGTRIEQAIGTDLLDVSRDVGVVAKFNWNGLQRGAFKDRTDSYSKALGAGGSPAWMTPNEVRALEEMNPIDGGDELPKPTNVAPKPSDDAGQAEPAT